MLFKRKSGNNGPTGQHAGHSDKESTRGEHRAPEQPSSDRSLHADWGDEARQEMASPFNKPDRRETFEEARHAMTQRGETKKTASIDWDVAAKEEITALFGGKGDAATGRSQGADSELESVRRAIAARKANTASSAENEAPKQQRRPGLLDFSVDSDDDRDPRLDWLVDFISDDDENPGHSSRKPDQPVHNAQREMEQAQRKPPSISTDSEFGPDDIELVLRAKEAHSENVHLETEDLMGDGFGNPLTAGNQTSEDPTFQEQQRKGQASFWSEVADDMPPAKTPDAGETTRTHDAPPNSGPSVSQRAQAPKPAAKPEERHLPQRRQTFDLDSLKSKDRVVGILLRKGLVTVNQVYEAQKIKEREGLRETLWRILVRMDNVNSDAVFEEAARVYAFPVADTEGKLDAKFVRSVMETLSDENKSRLLNLHLVPFECEAEQQSGAVKLVFITHDPMRAEVRSVMKELKLDRFDLYYAPKSAVDTLIVEAFPRKNEFLERITKDPMAFDLGMSYEEKDLIDEEVLEAEISRSSLINLFEATLVEAVRRGASDIHIYPNSKKRVEIHFRVDGRLMLWHTEHKVHPEALLAVIKDNAMNVDRFERDAAQDGYIQRLVDDILIRFRVSVLPIANASNEIRSESIVIRVLDDRKVIRDLRQLGLLDEAMQKFEQAISQPHGMVILTGPTGSGKSTSLVAALHNVISSEVNVLTVEDPVEYIIPGVRQIKLNFKLELEDALRAILRHDPDIVMVGEMRDRKTAELAIKLANTGHLTFSTLHTNDAPSAISRLYKMGIEPFLIAYAINLVVAQRLIRVLCTNCKHPDPDPDPVMLEHLGFTSEEIADTTFYLPGKDDHCPVCKGVGYKGRRAISEALYFSRNIRHLIVEADTIVDEAEIKDQAKKEGMLTLRDSAREIVKMGETSVQEMIRVVASE